MKLHRCLAPFVLVLLSFNIDEDNGQDVPLAKILSFVTNIDWKVYFTEVKRKPVRSAMLYGIETWTMKIEQEARFERIEM